MYKLTVWAMTPDSDSECYNIISRTKKDALATGEGGGRLHTTEPV
jgi:hypothetical protein